MSTGKTEHIGLNQWEAEDSVLRVEFNEDNAKLDAIIGQIQAEQLRLEVGSYTGTGTYGSANPNSLDFDELPTMLIIIRDGGVWTSAASSGDAINIPVAALADLTSFTAVGGTSSSNTSYYVKVGDTTLYWYNINSAHYQLNNSGKEYHYYALYL